MNGFIRKSVGTLTLGEKLKKLRNDRRISLNEVSKHTRIQIKYLEYVESGNYDKLPADVYVMGFLRNYAEFLGADEGALLKLYKKERGIKNNLEKGKPSRIDKPDSVDISFFSVTPRVITIALIIIFALAGVVYLYREIGSFAENPRLAILSPQNNLAIEGNIVVVEGITDRDARLTINNQPVLVGDDGRFKENINLQSGTNSIHIKSVNRFEKESSENLIVQSNFKEPENGSGRLSEFSEKKEFEMEIRVEPGPVWISVEADGNLVFSGNMLAGSSQNFTAQEKISINSGKGNATFIKLNGKEMGTLSENSGPVKDAVFTPEERY